MKEKKIVMGEMTNHETFVRFTIASTEVPLIIITDLGKAQEFSAPYEAGGEMPPMRGATARTTDLLP